MSKSNRKIINWKQYNAALVNRGSLTTWFDEDAVGKWRCEEYYGGLDRDSDIKTALMLKGIFGLSLRATEGFINSLFDQTGLPRKLPDYSSINKRAKTVEVKYRNLCRGPVAHLVIDATGLKIYGEGEWKTRKHGKEKHRTWRLRHQGVPQATATQAVKTYRSTAFKRRMVIHELTLFKLAS